MTNYPPVKPHGTFSLHDGAGYKKLDVPKIIPVHSSRIDWEVYCNITYRLKHPDQAAKVRIKMVREAYHGKADDPTAYNGFWLLPGFDNFLLTHTFWEIAEAHRPCHIELRVDKADITIGTRYAKADQP